MIMTYLRYLAMDMSEMANEYSPKLDSESQVALV